MAGTGLYKLETVHIPVGPDEPVDVPIDHPLQHHCKLVLTHHHSQQWQHILMMKSFPGDKLLTQALHGRHQPVTMHTSTIRKTNLCNLNKVACRKHIQHLDFNLDSFVFTLPYFRKPTSIPRGCRPSGIFIDRGVKTWWLDILHMGP